MKIKHIRCGICHDWHAYGVACHSCGARRIALVGFGKRMAMFVNRRGIEMVRGLAVPLHEMVRQDWQWCEEDRENIKVVRA